MANKREPLVSVMMPTYNGAAHLAEAIDSVLHQTFQDWELIVVDDGSTDETPDILREYSLRDARIKVFRIEHGGRGKARNKCLHESSGKYIAVLDSDDISVSERLALQEAFLEAHSDVGVVAGQVLFFDDHNSPRPISRYPETPEAIRAVFDRGKMGVCHGASMFRRSLIDIVGPYAEECLRAQDLEFFLRINEVARFAGLPDDVLLYRNNPAHMTYLFWVQLCKYGRYAVYRRNHFRRRNEPSRFEDWEKTFGCWWRVYLVDNLRYVKYVLKFKLRLGAR